MRSPLGAMAARGAQFGACSMRASGRRSAGLAAETLNSQVSVPRYSLTTKRPGDTARVTEGVADAVAGGEATPWAIAPDRGVRSSAGGGFSVQPARMAPKARTITAASPDGRGRMRAQTFRGDGCRPGSAGVCGAHSDGAGTRPIVCRMPPGLSRCRGWGDASPRRTEPNPVPHPMAGTRTP